jgi:hypothetical protein
MFKVGLHPDAGHLQMLKDIMVGVTQPFHKVYHAAGHGLLLDWGRFAKNIKLQGKHSSLPSTKLACIMNVVSWIDALYTSRKRGCRSSKSFQCDKTIFPKSS